jgi:hypothetical protein
MIEAPGGSMVSISIFIAPLLLLPVSWWIWIIGWLALLLLIFVGVAVLIFAPADKPQRHAQEDGRKSLVGSVLKTPLGLHLFVGEIISSSFTYSELSRLSVAGLGLVFLILLLIAIALLFLLMRRSRA